jgi:UDP-N-acetylmuramyl pentapeptide synthase
VRQNKPLKFYAAKGKEIINFGLGDFNDIRPTEQGFLVTLQHHIFEVPFLAKFNFLNVLSARWLMKTIALWFVDKPPNLGDNLNGLV